LSPVITTHSHSAPCRARRKHWEHTANNEPVTSPRTGTCRSPHRLLPGPGHPQFPHRLLPVNPRACLSRHARRRSKCGHEWSWRVSRRVWDAAPAQRPPCGLPTSVIALAPLPSPRPRHPPHDASPRSDPNSTHILPLATPSAPSHPLISPQFRSNSIPLPPPRPGFRSSPRFATWVVLVSLFALPLLSIPTG
jgi:hypothetical protein